MQDYEKLGAFYLGRPYDLKTKQAKDGLLLTIQRTSLLTPSVLA